MIGRNTLLENIGKLNTLLTMNKSNNVLNTYIDKILNKKCKTLEYISDYDVVSLDLLYLSLMLLCCKNKINFNVMDRKELKYYFDLIGGVEYFKKQVSSLKNEETIIGYLKEAMCKGDYICNVDNKVKFGLGIVVPYEWLITLLNFLVSVFLEKDQVDNNAKEYTFKVVLFSPELSFDNIFKETKVYEYRIKKINNEFLSYENIMYLNELFKDTLSYDFKDLQDINSKLAKNGFSLSVDKRGLEIKKAEKSIILKMINEGETLEEIKEYIKEISNDKSAVTRVNRKRMIENLEVIRGLAYFYKMHGDLEKARKLIDDVDGIMLAREYVNLYINYIYDEDNLLRLFNYELLDFNDIKPSIIDYETMEYKDILRELSTLNKKVVTLNKKINRYLDNGRIVRRDRKLFKENEKNIEVSCEELNGLQLRIESLRLKLDETKDLNHNQRNVNRMKMKYIKEAIISGSYKNFAEKIVFDYYNEKDYRHMFHLEMTLADFKEVIFSEHNINVRINFYHI